MMPRRASKVAPPLKTAKERRLGSPRPRRGVTFVVSSHVTAVALPLLRRPSAPSSGLGFETIVLVECTGRETSSTDVGRRADLLGESPAQAGRSS